MKTNKTITRLLTMALAVAALAAAGLLSGASWVQPVEAQTGDGSVKFISYASVGIVHGQKVSLCAGNVSKATGNLSLSFSFYLAHGSISSSSVPLFESEWIKVPPAEVRCTDVSREDLKTEGETRTGRAQVLVKATTIAPAGSTPQDVPVSLEVLEDEVQSGNALQRDTKYRLVIVAARRSKLNAPIGLVPEHMLRFAFFNPDAEGSQTVRVTTYTYDSMGRLARQTNPVQLRPGEGCTFDIDGADLRVADDGTGPVQVHSVVQVALMDGSVRYVPLHGSMELVAKSTGTTVSGGEYFTGTVTVSADGFDE
ncbi:MAG TPA: hypothetical protein VFR51_14455 [Pyrinomonadaceae bacterium]|nr:hypothetical protein [Pyrinomonadaceae bacterium]